MLIRFEISTSDYGFGIIWLILVRISLLYCFRGFYHRNKTLPYQVLLNTTTTTAKLIYCCLELDATITRDERRILYYLRVPVDLTQRPPSLDGFLLWGKFQHQEHIGTKTAVQIRSHAQKFFTKLEKEAVVKGVPIKQALDMEIPPPRPKRKPNYPYPRKTGPKTDLHMAEKHGKQTTLVSSLLSLDLERKTLPEKTSHEELKDTKTSEEGENGDEGSQEAPCASLSSENENSVPRSNPGVFKKFIPGATEEEVTNHDESYITIETRKHQEMDQDGNKHTNITSNISLFESSHLTHDSIIPGIVQNYPRHVPVQVVDGNQGIHAKTTVTPEMSYLESTVNNLGEVLEHPNTNLYVDTAAAASATSGHHNNASRSSNVPLFTPFSDNQENYSSLLHVSSTISSLIISSLLQNPAAHAQASFAANFWNPVNATTSSGDQLNTETPPSMAAIVAATIAAATAWWSTHGLLPVCTPFYPGSYSCTFGTPVNGNQPRVYNNVTDKAPSEHVLPEEKMDAEKTEDFPHSEPAADLSSSGDSEEKSNTEASPVDEKEMAPGVELQDLSKTNVRKQVDRSSCGSNTTSSSENEMDALEKHVKGTEETRGSDINESFSRRGRTSIVSPNESWKEVSEEGRLAFQALFSRDILPQSFSANRTVAENDQQNIVKNSELDLNRVSQEPGESNGLTLLRTGLGSVKLNVHHTGFKPYKRCSIEAKESSNKNFSAAGAASTGKSDEKCPKRIRLETDVST